LTSATATVVCGHTHMPFDRLAAGRRVVNPGSVGMPYGPPAAAEVIQASGYPDGAAWAREYVLHHYSDTEALTAFTEIAGQ
jgi:diadenosine tetraphosphatase ApaH/serine/threonine PP2A family protein phosphatase